MTRLNPDAHEILDLAYDLDDPSDDDRHRHRAKLVARLGAATALTVSVPAGAASTVLGAGSVAAATSGVLAKSALVFALLGGVAGGTVCALGEIARPYLHAPAVSTPIQPVLRERSPEPAAQADTAARPTAPSVPVETAPASTPTSPGAPVRRETRETAPPATQQQTPSARTLQEEVDLIRRAHGALRANDPALALQYVAEHAARFPNGSLTQERVATRVLAVCSLHRPGAVDEARAFLSAQPDSPLASRVRAACGL